VACRQKEGISPIRVVAHAKSDRLSVVDKKAKARLTYHHFFNQKYGHHRRKS